MACSGLTNLKPCGCKDLLEESKPRVGSPAVAALSSQVLPLVSASYVGALCRPDCPAGASPELGEDYLSLLPETIPFLAELMEGE